MSKLFYHYTSLNVLYSIVSRDELWLSNLRNSNDPNELYLSCDEYNSYVLDKLGVNPYHGRPNISSTNKVVGDAYGISLTTLEDDLGQWDRYGDQSRGVAIAFDIEAMNEYLEKTHGFHLSFGAIKYSEQEKLEYIRELVSGIPSCGDQNANKYWPIYGLYFTIHYALARVLFKRECFELEKEYRLYVDLVEQKFQVGMIERLLAQKPDELLNFQHELRETTKKHGLVEENKKYAIMRNGINSYLSLDLSLLGTMKKHFIKKIILGPRCTQNIEELAGFMETNGFSANIEHSCIEVR